MEHIFINDLENKNYEITIIAKEKARNVNWNTNKVYFKINNDEMDITILYIKSLKMNSFITDISYNNVKTYCKKHNIDFNQFKDRFLYFLYKYSKGRGLDISKLKGFGGD